MARAGELMNAVRAAEFLGVTPETLRAWNQNGHGPPRARIGKRYYYVKEALRDWLRAAAASVRHAPSQPQPASGAPATNGAAFRAQSPATRR